MPNQNNPKKSATNNPNPESLPKPNSKANPNPNPTCPTCKSKNTTKKGTKKNKNQTLQRYKCKNCKKTFTKNPIKNITYPIKTILNSISFYNLGHTLQKTSDLINKRSNKNTTPTTSPQTISIWTNKYKTICTYHKLRNEAAKLYPPKNLIFRKTFIHIQPYTFKYHKAKLNLLFHNKLYNNKYTNHSKYYEPIKSYLEKIPTKQFPHHIFKEFKHNNSNKNNSNNKKNNTPNEKRASQLKFKHLKITKTSKNNLANKLTKLALNLAKSNKHRHDAIQNFMLTNDSTTIAVEIPVYLTSSDIKYYQSRKFKLSFENPKTPKTTITPITGHIDILQIRNNLIHILDYKPNADQNHVQAQAIQQLIIYALSLSSRIKLPLSNFKCAWFDENNFYEFYPLNAVYHKMKSNKAAIKNPLYKASS